MGSVKAYVFERLSSSPGSVWDACGGEPCNRKCITEHGLWDDSPASLSASGLLLSVSGCSLTLPAVSSPWWWTLSPLEWRARQNLFSHKLCLSRHFITAPEKWQRHTGCPLSSDWLTVAPVSEFPSTQQAPMQHVLLTKKYKCKVAGENTKSMFRHLTVWDKEEVVRLLPGSTMLFVFFPQTKVKGWNLACSSQIKIQNWPMILQLLIPKVFAFLPLTVRGVGATYT